MSVVKLLQMVNIRNYGERDNKQIVRFKRGGVTLILGDNGAGKTTIIESIVCALTGEYPPNSNQGRDFVQIPELNNLKQKNCAFIKLEIEDRVGKPLMVSRCFDIKKRELTARMPYSVTTGGASLKGFDMVSKKITEMHQTSADMNMLIPTLMGVSKSILKNVIFCHQEESLWPFGNSKLLNTIFDDIFETKNFSEVSKRMKEVKKVLKEEERELRVNLIKKREKFEQMIGSLNRLRQFFQDLKDNKQKIKQEEKNKNLIKGMGISTADIEDKIKAVERKITYLDIEFEQAMRRLKKLGVEEEDNIVDLEKKEDDLEEIIKRKETDVEVLEGLGKKIKELRSEMEEVRKKKEELEHLEVFDLNGEKRRLEKYGKEIEELTEFKYTSQGDFGLKVKNFLENFGKENEARKSQLEEEVAKVNNTLINTKVELAQKKKEFDEVTEKISVLERKDINKDQIKEKNIQERDELEKDLKGVVNKMDEIMDEMNKLKRVKSHREEEQEKMIMKNKRIKNGRRVMKLFKTFDKLKKVKNYFDENKIFLNKKELLDNYFFFRFEKSLDNIIKEYDDISVELYKIKTKIKKKVKDKKKEISDNENLIFFNNRKIGDFKEEKEILKKKIKDMKISIKKKLEEKGEKSADELIQEFKDLKKELDELNQKIPTLEMIHNGIIYRGMMNISKEKNSCLLCENKFGEVEFKTAESNLKSFGSKLEEDDLFKKVVNRRKELTEQISSYKEIEEWETEIEILKSRKEVLQNKIFNVKTENLTLEEIKEGFNSDLSDFEEELSILTQFAWLIDQLNFDENGQQGFLEEIKNILEEEDEYKKNHDFDIERVYCRDIIEENANKKIFDIEREELNPIFTQNLIDERYEVYSDWRNKKSKIKKKLEELNQKISISCQNLEGVNATDLNKRRYSLGNEIVELKENLDMTKEEILEKKNKLENLRKNEFEKKVKVEMRFKEYEKISEKISGFDLEKFNENEKVIERKTKVRRIYEKLSIEIEESESQKHELEKKIFENGKKIEILTLKKKMISNKTEKKSLTDNKKDLEKQKGEVSKNQRLYQESECNLSKLVGSKEALVKAGKDCQRSLKKRRNAESEYSKALVEHELAKHSIKDIDLFIESLKESIQIYHQEKLEEINLNIESIWNKCYHGKDITKIELKCLNEKIHVIDVNSEYKVVFYKRVKIEDSDEKYKEIEIDMKGRSSAGQRVLASIVIRMALAECLSENCGILTLDEPTTNLDREHIKILADFLGNLIEERKNNEGFQLIVITHDQEFIKMMKGFTEQYWHVTRKGHQNMSIIDVKSMKDLG